MRTQNKKTRSCSKSSNQELKLENISFELVIEILLRLPVKSIARYRIVSKLWQSTLASPYFTESFFTISSSRPPKLLFTCLKDERTFFFSSSSSTSSSPPCPPIVANFHTSFSINCPNNSCRPVRGFVCGLRQHNTKGGTVTVPLICNPSTDQVIPLPRLKTRRKGVISFFVYDPINKHFKVLCMTKSFGGIAWYTEEHQVLTLETGKKTSLSSWRMIKCDVQHTVHGYYKSDHGICINGILYYLAYITDGNGFPDIVCFDIRLEEFSYIRKADQGMNIINMGAQLESTLVNYKGKLAKLQANTFNYNILTSIQLWVLEDAEKHKWSSFIYVMPPPWNNITKEDRLCFVGTTPSGEIVLSPRTVGNFFYLAYYKPERNTISIVGIKGMEAINGHRVHTFLDHEENVEFVSNQMFRIMRS